MGVSQLRHSEAVSLDIELLDQMCARMGYTKAEEAIRTAMEDLAVLLQYSGTLARTNELTNLDMTARQIDAVALRIGMCALSRVATDVYRLCHFNDPVALAATVARMRRVGEASLIAIWDRDDLMI